MVGGKLFFSWRVWCCFIFGHVDHEPQAVVALEPVPADQIAAPNCVSEGTCTNTKRAEVQKIIHSASAPALLLSKFGYALNLSACSLGV